MQRSDSPVFNRDDTFLGVCEALGQDFGFNANYLRIALGVLLLWNPVVVISAYLVAGLVVAVSRWLVPAAAGHEPEAVWLQHETPNDNQDSDALAVAA